MESAQKLSPLAKELFSALVDQVEEIIDEEKQKDHNSISRSLHNSFPDISKKLGVEPESLSVQVQSGGVFDPDLLTNKDNLSYDVVFLGLRVSELRCVRTLLINPTAEVKKWYLALYDLVQVAQEALQADVSLGQVHQKVVTALQAREPELLKYLPSVLGVGPNGKSITADSSDKAQAGEQYELTFALNNLQVPSKFKCKSSAISVVIYDTVQVNKGKSSELLTDVVREYSEISYSLEDEEEPEPKRSKPKVDLEELEHKGVVRSSRLRNQINTQNIENERRRKDNQKEIRDKKLEELRQRFSNNEMGEKDKSEGQKSLSEISAYSSREAMPSGARPNQIYVDTRHEAVLLPIHGQIVPFHVSTIKNVSKNEEGQYFFLRINFVHPGAGIIKDASYTLPELKEPNSFYIKELTFRSSNSKNLNSAFRLLKELIKRVKAKDYEENEKKNLVDQEKLILIKGKRPVLPDVTIRPNISGKKTEGSLEAHQNGLRFVSSRGEKLDIIYSNIKQAIFQPVENELIVLVHFYLHNSIMVGTKKTLHLQFYAEAGIQSDDLDMRRRSGMDLDEIQQEQRERKYKEKLNKEFKNFCEQVQQVSGEKIDFDIPYRELGFYGVPYKTNVFIMPSVNCLLSLIEQPFFIIMLNEIEIAHFERVHFGLRNFDLVFVFKDYTKPPMRICSIPAEYLESIKDWLNDIDILYSESVNPMNWGNIMKEITKDLESFIEEGGWNFLQDSDSEGQPQEDSEQEEDPEFEEAEYESEEEEESEMSEASEPESEDSAQESEEEDGLDWEELEENARKMDAKKRAAKEAKASKKSKS
mmetsp:Transcript_2232/g.3562  ORF Transcript_2232/g.3562 Transcript_2232/m.3562 type:complete len:816 (-) Transcript_2232:34-2481(-)